MYGHEPLLVAAVVGRAEVVPLLQDRPELAHLAKRPGTRHLAREPVPFALVVGQVELRVAVPRNPDRPGRHARRPAQRNKQRHHVLVASLAAAQRGQPPGQRRLLLLHVLAHVVVDRLDLLPGRLLVRAQLLGQRADLRMPRFDERARAQVTKHRTIQLPLVGNHVDRRVVRQQLRAAANLQRGQGLRLLARRQVRDPDPHHFHPAVRIQVLHLGRRREVLLVDLHVLLGPLAGHGGVGFDPGARPRRGLDGQPRLPLEHLRLAELGALPVGLLELGRRRPRRRKHHKPRRNQGSQSESHGACLPGMVSVRDWLQEPRERRAVPGR